MSAVVRTAGFRIVRQFAFAVLLCGAVAGGAAVTAMPAEASVSHWTAAAEDNNWPVAPVAPEDNNWPVAPVAPVAPEDNNWPVAPVAPEDNNWPNASYAL